MKNVKADRVEEIRKRALEGYDLPRRASLQSHADVNALLAELDRAREERDEAREAAFEAGFWAGRGEYRSVLEAWHAHTGQEPLTLEQLKDRARAFLQREGNRP